MFSDFSQEQFLSHTELFSHIAPEEIRSVLFCLGAIEKTYEKGETIYRAGQMITDIGMVLSGSVNMVVNFVEGDSRIFGHFEAGEAFGENYAAIENRELIGDIVAMEKTRVLFMDLRRVMQTCSRNCSSHNQLNLNLLHIAARKNLGLSSRMLHISYKSIRERVVSYLSEQAMLQDTRVFSIPFDRQQMADYLGVDRSQMSFQR